MSSAVLPMLFRGGHIAEAVPASAPPLSESFCGSDDDHVIGSRAVGPTGAPGSPRKGYLAQCGFAPLSLLPDELLLDGRCTHPEMLCGITSPRVSSMPRDIRARPLDIEKEIPLLFVDEGQDAIHYVSSPRNGEHGVSRQQLRDNATPSGYTAAMTDASFVETSGVDCSGCACACTYTCTTCTCTCPCTCNMYVVMLLL